MGTAVLSLLAVQRAVLTRLRANASLLELVPSERIVDAVPDTIAGDYVVFDAPSEFPDRTFGQDGREVTFELRVVTKDGSQQAGRTGGAGFKRGLEVADRVARALGVRYPLPAGELPLTVDGFDVIDIDVLAVGAERGDDGVTREIRLPFVMTLETR